MATTTPNFGWAVPTSTDLVKDGAVAIETLGDSIDASLVDLKGGTTGQVLAKASGTDMDFSWVAQDDSNAIQNALLTTTGDTIYASGASTPARRAIGTTGQVLTVSGGVPVWATPAGGGGKVLQVVSATYSSFGTNSTTTYADTGLSVSITPSSASSKVLIIATQNGCGKYSSDANTNLFVRLMRDSTQIGVSTGSANVSTTQLYNFIGTLSNVILDSPATTSAITYKTQFRNSATAAYVAIQNENDNSTIIAMEIGA